MSTLTNNIFSSVKMLADKAVTSYKTDRSVVGTIASIKNAATGEYGVEYNSIIITAKSIGNEQYNIKDKVYLLIPDNDFENTKFILGLSTKNSSNLTKENPIDKQFNLFGSRIIINNYKTSDTAPDIEFNSNITAYSFDGTTTTVNSQIVKEAFEKAVKTLESQFKNDITAFVVSANIKSNFPEAEKGNFGIRIKMKYTDGEREYSFSSSEMQAENVYMMLDFTKQKQAFENINNETFQYISEISIFNDMGGGLVVKDLEIYGAKRIADPASIATLSIESINDLIDISQINKGNNGANIVLQAVLKDSNQRVIQNTTYTWYQENTTVEDGTSEKGGAGWAPINSDNINDNELTINNKEQFASTSCRFKCIATTSSGMSFDAYYTLYNKDGINLSLTRKDNTLTCSAKDSSNNEVTGLSYQWYKMLNNGTTWDILADKKNNSLTVEPDSININEKYRCVVSYTADGKYVGYAEIKVYNPQYENVRTIELYYMRSNSYIKAPGADDGGWQKTIPEETDDKIWVWQKTVTIYEDGREVVNSIVQIKGIPGEKGADGVGQKEQLFLYAYTYSVDDKGSPIAPPIPSFPEETIIEISSTSTNVGEKGITKDDLVKVTGYYNDGTLIQYELNYDGDNLFEVNIAVPEGKEFTKATLFYYKAPSNWQFNTQPVTKDLPYQWKYTFIIYTDNTYVTDGPTLEAIWVDGIESIITQWAASDEGTNAPSEGWTDIFAEVANTNKKYIWVRELITYKSKNTEPTTPRKDLANNAIKNWAISTDQTYINGAKIYTGTIDARQIKVDDLSSLNATIGGWNIGSSDFYTKESGKNDGFLISAYKPQDTTTVVQRLAAGKSIKESTVTEKMIEVEADYIPTINDSGNITLYKATANFQITDVPEKAIMKIDAYFWYQNDDTKNHLGSYTEQGTQWFKLLSTDGINYQIKHDFTPWDKRTPIGKLVYEVTYNYYTREIENPVFELLSDGTGTIGGWDITESGLEKQPSASNSDGILLQTKDDTLPAFALGWTANSKDAPFQVSMKGEVTATSGEIGKWEITENGLKSPKETIEIIRDLGKDIWKQTIILTGKGIIITSEYVEHQGQGVGPGILGTIEKEVTWTELLLY